LHVHIPDKQQNNSTISKASRITAAHFTVADFTDPTKKWLPNLPLPNFLVAKFSVAHFTVAQFTIYRYYCYCVTPQISETAHRTLGLACGFGTVGLQ